MEVSKEAMGPSTVREMERQIGIRPDRPADRLEWKSRSSVPVLYAWGP